MSLDFTDRKFAAAEIIAAKFSGEPETDCVYFAGSLTAGLGNERSDVDLFVITGTGRPLDTTQYMVDGERIDVEFRSTGWLESVLGCLDEANTFTRADLGPVSRSFDEVVRLMLSRPVLDSDRYRQARRVLAEKNQRLRQLLVGCWSVGVAGTTQDCYGSLLSGDGYTTRFMSRSVLSLAGQAYCAMLGDMYFPEKWVLAKLARSAGSTFPLETYRRLVLGDHGLEWEDMVHQAIRLSQATLTAASLSVRGYEWADDWTAWGETAVKGGLYRGLGWQPMVADDQAYLDESETRQARVSPRMLALWALCDGRPDEEIRREACRRLPDTTEQDIDNSLAKLQATGALVRE